jgi:hypothetical protein
LIALAIVKSRNSWLNQIQNFWSNILNIKFHTFFILINPNIVSITPAAPKAWPIELFIADMDACFACYPKTDCIALA